MGLSKIGTHQHSRLTWRVISGEKEKILKNCQNELTSKTNSNFFLKFQVDSAPVVPKKIATTP
jgi:transcription initiation factor IIE alpha subunit